MHVLRAFFRHKQHKKYISIQVEMCYNENNQRYHQTATCFQVMEFI